MDLQSLSRELRLFAQARDWEGFHTPKNLVMAMSVEMAELLEHFQWLTAEQSQQLAADPARLEAVALEMADVLLYLVRLADVLDVDLATAAARKLRLNAQKYPALYSEAEVPV